MKFINLLIWTLTLVNSIHSPISCNETSKTSANQVLIIFIRDENTNKSITDIPIPATYGGYFTISDHNGHIILPRKSEEANFKIIVTDPLILPVFTVLNNVSHFQIPRSNPTTMYSVTLNRSKNNSSEWTVKQEPLPQGRHIPLHSIVIFADPKTLSMQTGKTTTHFGEQLMLPSIYLDKTHSLNNASSLGLLNNQPFFKKLQTAYALTPYGYATLQVY